MLISYVKLSQIYNDDITPFKLYIFLLLEFLFHLSSTLPLHFSCHAVHSLWLLFLSSSVKKIT